MGRFSPLNLLCAALWTISMIERTLGQYEPCADLIECACIINDDLKLTVDCSGKKLSILPANINSEVQIMDLSNNLFTEIPPELRQFESLETLILTENSITSLNADSLTNLTKLHKLVLSRNNISRISDLSPSESLLPAVNLQELILSGNPITNFMSIDQNDPILVSPSLTSLDLSECHILKVRGRRLLSELPSLKSLDLSKNPVTIVHDISSESLEKLDLSQGLLSAVSSHAFYALTNLQLLNLSKNHRLQLSSQYQGNVTSKSVKHLDLSYCNVDQTGIWGFPNLTDIILKGNMIRQIREDSFANNYFLKNIDLSGNAINTIHIDSFRHLRYLTHLDLSLNIIPRIDRELFSNNEVLTTINLSRNHISYLDRLEVRSLIHLDLSWCEILSIDKDALISMPALLDLNLSHNLLREIPEDLSSMSLQTLDASMCRITAIRNETLRLLPELIRIKLTGNRLTTPPRVWFFAENHYLEEVALGDNPWRCDCSDIYFRDIYFFLIEPPSKINNRYSLRCESPEVFAGRTWDSACLSVWRPSPGSISQTEKIWMFLMVTLISFAACLCIVLSVRRAMLLKMQSAREEQNRAAEELRERQRLQRLRLAEDAQGNAPDPRELVSPPCYEDALLMPRLDGSFASLDHLPSATLRRKLKNRQMSSDELANKANGLNRRRTQSSGNLRNGRITDSGIDEAQSMDNIAIDNAVEIVAVAGTSQENVDEIVVEEPAVTVAAPVVNASPKTPPPRYKERHSATSSEEEIAPITVHRTPHESNL